MNVLVLREFTSNYWLPVDMKYNFLKIGLSLHMYFIN